MPPVRPLLSLALVALVALAVTAVPAAAQDLEGCDDFLRYVEREDYPRAIEELNWCKRSVEDMHYEKIKSLVDRTIAGYEPGAIEVEGAMGCATVQGTWSNGSDEIELSITSAGGAGAAAGASLSAISGLANAFGVRSAGTDQVRVAGLTGQLKEERDDRWSLMLTMDGGIVLTFEGSDPDVLEEFAEEVIPDLEDYLG